MFSLIKYLQGLKERLQRNKGLWFTTITTISVLGIIITMYIIMSMTSNVSQKVYSSMSKEYHVSIENFLESKKGEFQKVALSLAQNTPLLQSIENNDQQSLIEFDKSFNELLAKNGMNNYVVTIYAIANKEEILRTSVVSVVQSKNSVYGFEVMADGVFNVYLQPLIKDDKVYGVIELKESIHNYRQYFEGLNDEYVFLLDKKMLPKISIDAKNGRYKDMIGDLSVEKTFYDTKFTASIPELEEEQFAQMKLDGYIIDNIYYRTYKNVVDINGANIGMIVTGEIIDKEDGFVNLADNMTKTITTVALGLVISIMLFMF